MMIMMMMMMMKNMMALKIISSDRTSLRVCPLLLAIVNLDTHFGVNVNESSSNIMIMIMIMLMILFNVFISSPPLLSADSLA